jgi:hypothetical protein
MRLRGFVTINGTRERLDWTISGTGVTSGPGVSAHEVELTIPMPEIIEKVIEEYDDGYENMTVVDIRLLLSERGEPVYGTKADLIGRLRAWVAANPDAAAPTEDEAVEEASEEMVTEDGAESE